MTILLILFGLLLFGLIRQIAANSCTVTTTIVQNGNSYPNVQVTNSTGNVGDTATVAAAKTGTLTTRTNNTTGTLTMQAGHGFTTGSIISLFWPIQTSPSQPTSGMITTVTVGTVSGNSVPITTLGGAVLPVLNSVITAMIPTQLTFSIPEGDNCVMLIFNSVGTPGFVTLSQLNGTVIETFQLVADSSPGSPNYNYQWTSGNGITNPISGGSSGADVAYALFSHGDSTASHQMSAAALINL